LAGLGRKPNVGSVLVVGLGGKTLKPELLADQIAASVKPTGKIIIQEPGGISATISKGNHSKQFDETGGGNKA